MPIQSELMRRLFWHRGIQDEQELDYSLTNMLNPKTLHNREAATEILSRAIIEDSRIMIVGDYDVDGATATTLGIRVLRAFGAKHVQYIVPDRFKHGYGLSKEIAEEALRQEPELVVTVDNGISSIEGVKTLKNQGVKVLITDHHLPGENLPEADAILNPNQKGCQFGSKNLAGVGVMFYLLIMVRRSLIENGWFEASGLEPPNLANYLDLVALGTVADVVPLDRNNRILVSQGLSRNRAGKCCWGIMALLEITKRKTEEAL
ncbi:MAG: single-stranded-DNA-specific exonuclease RecJ, partial [Gammaproteobacteria bacterium]|nr:single-stranded-DNA-specific exonuclease RecJ [Gammaproteobacteria bacterium]